MHTLNGHLSSAYSHIHKVVNMLIKAHIHKNTHSQAVTHPHLRTHMHTYKHTYLGGGKSSRTSSFLNAPPHFLTHLLIFKRRGQQLQSVCGVNGHPPCHELCRLQMCRVGQNVYVPYMTVYLVISLPKIPYIHHIYMVLANPANVCCTIPMNSPHTFYISYTCCTV